MRAYRCQWHAACALGLAAMLAGCASQGPRPDSELMSASSAVEQAEASLARQYEPVLLNEAQNKIADARELIDREENDQARALLKQAEVDAQLAAARSETAKARQAVEEINKNIEQLRMQMESSAQ
ncbi:DUF4398 domain-containing protein [Marinobacter zhejiangensis]|uniref:DUF4398 domain-containing protein n=1 Tax=Marinobacter zhejiangensis TaxID=488535 RepID=A0A1I4LH58_9GAMM|nr:DUF4398 domain-containing protein [Marinobacter zhejiangensis]SFL90302.1 protein of unknown function [Marinobacter zhejiangensis]